MVYACQPCKARRLEVAHFINANGFTKMSRMIETMLYKVGFRTYVYSNIVYTRCVLPRSDDINSTTEAYKKVAVIESHPQEGRQTMSIKLYTATRLRFSY